MYLSHLVQYVGFTESLRPRRALIFKLVGRSSEPVIFFRLLNSSRYCLSIYINYSFDQ